MDLEAKKIAQAMDGESSCSPQRKRRKKQQKFINGHQQLLNKNKEVEFLFNSLQDLITTHKSYFHPMPTSQVIIQNNEPVRSLVKHIHLNLPCDLGPVFGNNSDLERITIVTIKGKMNVFAFPSDGYAIVYPPTRK